MLKYIVQGKYVDIIGCTDDETNVVIPESIDGCSVIRIAENAFVEHPSLISVSIPKTVKAIDSYAFASCKKLKKVIIHDGLEYINDWAFISCNIDDINLPETLIHIGENAFLGSKCYNLINDWRENHKTVTPNIVTSTYDLCIIPSKSISSPEIISQDLVKKIKAYHNLQINNFNDNKDYLYALDLPYIFDNQEFIIAINSDSKFEEVSINIPASTYMHVGNYADDDPDFILFELQVISINKQLGSVYFKIPYPDDVEFKIESHTYINGVNVIKINSNISSFGCGNIDREFAINQYDEILAKFNTAYNNRLITFDEHDEIERKLYCMGLNKVKELIENINNPVLNHTYKIFEFVLKDTQFEENHYKVNEYLNNKIKTIYNTLSDITSLHDVCFDTTSDYKFLKSVTNLDKEQLIELYNLQIIDDNGFVINCDHILELSNDFYENEELYNIHGYLYNDILSELSDFIEENYNVYFLENLEKLF